MLHKGKPRIFDASRSASNSRTPSTFTHSYNGKNPHLTKNNNKLHSKSTYFYRWSHRAPVLPAFAILALLIGIIGISPFIYSRSVHATSIALTMTSNPDEDTTNYTPITAGEVATREYGFAVAYSDIDKYWISVNTENGNGGRLVGAKNPTFQIDGVGENATINNFKNNTWGYALKKYDTTIPDVNTLTYNTVPEFSKPMLATESPVTNSSTEAIDKYSLVFATKLGNDAPSDHYKTNVYLSVTMNANDVARTLNKISTMQEMTASGCEKSTIGDTNTLTDTRDGSTYTVAKFKDDVDPNGRCWMTQNLRIINKTITPADSNVTSNFTIPASNSNGFNTSDQYTAKAYYANNTEYGAYYNHFTATAGASKSGVDSGTMTTSICPKGWILPPTNGITESGTYRSLLAPYNLETNGGSQIRQAPFNFALSGLVQDSSAQKLGNTGYLWSATIYSAYNARSLNFQYATSSVNPYDHYSRSYGFPVRCVNDPNA